MVINLLIIIKKLIIELNFKRSCFLSQQYVDLSEIPAFERIKLDLKKNLLRTKKNFF